MESLKTVSIANPDESLFKELLPSLVRLYELAYKGLSLYAYHGYADVRDYLRWLYEGDPNGFFVAFDEGQAVGFASIHSEWRAGNGETVGELHELVVSPDYRRLGIARDLIARALEYAQAKGRTKIRLWVGQKNNAAIALYRRLGFTPLAKHGIWERMELQLTKNQ